MQNFIRRRSRRVVAAAMLAALPSVCSASTFIWSGGDTAHGYFSLGDNWAGTAPPASGADLIFGVTNAASSAPFADSPYSLNSITFNSSAYPYNGSHNLEANTLTLTGAKGISDQAANAEAISNPVLLGGTQTWNVSGTSLALSNTTLNNTNSSVLTKIGAGTLNLGLSNSSASSISAFSQTGGTTTLTSGTLTLSTTTTNPLAVTNGTFNITGGVVNTSTPNSSFQSVLVDSGGSLLVTGTGSQLNANQTGGAIVLGNTGNNASLTVGNHGAASTVTTFVGSTSGSDSLTVNSAGQFKTSFLYVGAFTSGGGAVTVTDSGSLATVTSQIALGGYLSAGGTGTLAINGSATVTTPGASFYTSGSSVSINGGALTTGSLNDIGSATGSVSLVADPTGGSALNVNGSTGSYIFAGTVSGAGSILKTGGSTQTLSGNINTSGNIVVSGGNLTFSSSGNSSVSTLQVKGGTANVSAGTLQMTSGADYDLVTSGGALTVSNLAVLTSHAGACNLDGGGSLTVTGAGSQYVGGGELAVGFVSPGTLNIQSGGALVGTNLLVCGGYAQGNMVITSGGSANCVTGNLGEYGSGNGTATVTGTNSSWNCSGALYIGGTVQLGGSAGNTGLLAINNSGAVQTAITYFESNSATVNISGGTFTTGYLSSYNTGNGAINLLADPSGATALTINDAAAADVNTYSGTITGAGSLNKSGGSTQILSGTNTFTGGVQVNGGALVLSGTNNFSDLYVPGGTAQISAGTLSLNAQAVIPFFVEGSSSVVNISNGAVVNSTAASSFYSATRIDGGAIVNVTGSGSQLATPNTSQGVDVGGYIGSAVLNLTTGASLSSGNYVNVGGYQSGTSGVMNISSGSTVTTVYARVGFTQGSTGTLNVNGSGSVLNASMSLAIGGSGLLNSFGGVGYVTVTNNGVINAPTLGFLSATASLNISGGAVNTASLSSYAAGFGSVNLVDPASGFAFNISGAEGSNTYSGSIAGTGSIEKTGGSLQVLAGADTFTGAVQVTGGVLEFTTRNNFSSLVISGGTAQINGSGNILVVPTLAVITGGTLDLTTDSADISASSLSVVNALAQKGFNNGFWTGAGLTSSNASANTRHLTAIGVIQNNQGGTAIYTASHQFENITPGAGDVLAKYTYYGDANLDSKVDGSDYSRIDSAFQTNKANPNALTGWFNGDFNYDGVVNGSDYTLIDNAFNSQGTTILDVIATPTSQIVGSASVPEPSSILAIALASIAMLGRRRGRV